MFKNKSIGDPHRVSLIAQKFASRWLKSLRKTLPLDVGGLAASSELRFQDALNGLTSVAAEPQGVRKRTAHQKVEGCLVSHALRTVIGFQEFGSRPKSS